jgi:hypothetical protein
MFEWGVAAFLVFAGLIAGLGIYWGKRDPSTAPFLPSIEGLFQLGRIRVGREDREQPEEREKNKDGSQPGSK